VDLRHGGHKAESGAPQLDVLSSSPTACKVSALSLKQYQKEATAQHNGRTAGVECMLPNLHESKGLWRRQAKEALLNQE
jgi:hypothetical protein